MLGQRAGRLRFSQTRLQLQTVDICIAALASELLQPVIYETLLFLDGETLFCICPTVFAKDAGQQDVCWQENFLPTITPTICLNKDESGENL